MSMAEVKLQLEAALDRVYVSKKLFASGQSSPTNHAFNLSSSSEASSEQRAPIFRSCLVYIASFSRRQPSDGISISAIPCNGHIAFRVFRMSDTTTQPTVTRGRGRGKSRGGLGKYLRARGRGRGSGRPAEFSTRLLLEGEGRPSLTEEEEAELAKELAEKYSRRQLGTNADRYKEEEPELDSDGVFSSVVFRWSFELTFLWAGEPIVEPEVDLSTFLEKQRISDDVGPSLRVAEAEDDDNDDVDTSLAHITSKSIGNPVQASRKGKVEQIVWDEELDTMNREKKAAEATRGKF